MVELWHDRLKLALKARGKKAADLVRLTGAKASSVSDWLNGETGMMEAKYSALVCDFLGISPLWLFHNRGPSGLDDESNVEVGSEMHVTAHPVPVVGTAQLGPEGFWEAIDYPVGHGEGFVRYPTKDPNAYALRVKGDSMRPRIKPGEFVLIEPNTAFLPGNEVMVQKKNGESMVKVLDFRRNGIMQLSSVNETDFKPITLEDAEVAKIHRVAAIIPSDLYYRDNT